MTKKLSSLKPTSKKQKILKGVEYFINKDTGEEIPFVVQSVEDRDFKATPHKGFRSVQKL